MNLKMLLISFFAPSYLHQPIESLLLGKQQSHFCYGTDENICVHISIFSFYST